MMNKKKFSVHQFKVENIVTKDEKKMTVTKSKKYDQKK